MRKATKNDIGKWCKFSYCDEIELIAILDEIDSYGFYPKNKDAEWIQYDHCTPLTQEQIKILGLKNEKI